jgi:thymidylate kinase
LGQSGQILHVSIVNGGPKLLNSHKICGNEEESLSSSGAWRSISVQSQVARLLIRKLTEECESYCILTGYEELPDKFDTDIDFMVNASDFARIPAMLDEIAWATGTRLFQVIPHEISGRAFRLAASVGECLTFVQPDSCADYRHFGKLWLRADEVLASRRWHPKGFWIPGAPCEFIYYLIKRISKRDLTVIHGARLSRLYSENPSGCRAWLSCFWKEGSANLLAEMAEACDWRPLVQNLENYRDELRRHSPERWAFGRRALHTIDRILQPTGGWVAFIGPDGCGKSAVIGAMTSEFAPAFQEIVRCHLRPKSLPARGTNEVPVTDPHGQPVRGAVYSIAKMLYLFSDYWLGYLRRVRTETVRTRLVIFDRYFYDILVDPERVRYGGPKWLPRLLSHVIPRPEIIFLLDAAPDVLWSRKQEVRYGEVVRQRREFLELARKIAGAVVIDASRPLHEVTLQVREEMLNYFALRTRHRLMLKGRSGSIAKVR